MAMDGFGAAESLYQQDPEVWGQGTIKTRRCVEWYEEFLLDIRDRWEDEKCVSKFQLVLVYCKSANHCNTTRWPWVVSIPTFSYFLVAISSELGRFAAAARGIQIALRTSLALPGRHSRMVPVS